MVFIVDIQNVSEDLSTAVLRDVSQYGGSSPDRNELALYLYLYKRDASDVDTPITVDNSDPLNVVAWSFDLPAADGVFVAVIFGFYIWSAGTYANGDCVYYSGSYYKANTSTTSTPGADSTWDLISDIKAEVTGNTTVEQTQAYAWSDAHSSSGALADQLADLAPSVRDGRCRDFNKASKVLWLGALLESAYANFRRADYQDAQSSIDYIQQNVAA